MTTVTVERSPWGFSAYFPNGRAIAHSKDKKLLHEYLGECAGVEIASATPTLEDLL